MFSNILFDFFHFPVSEADHAGVFALWAEQWEILQHRMRPYLGSRLAAAFWAAEPIQLWLQIFRHLIAPVRLLGQR